MSSFARFFLTVVIGVVLNACGDGSGTTHQKKTTAEGKDGNSSGINNSTSAEDSPSGGFQIPELMIIDCAENARLFDNDHRSAKAVDTTKNAGCGKVGTRQFVYDLPKNFNPARSEPYPVVYAWHGCGSSGGGFRNIINITARSAEPVISIYPDSDEDDNCWNVWSENESDVAFFDSLHSAVIKNFKIDEDRVFSVGYSAGAHMSHQLACAGNSVIRGLATVAGAVLDSARENSCTLPMPALIAHGSEDTSVPYQANFETTLERYINTNGCQNSSFPFESKAPSKITDAGITFDCRTQTCDTMLRYCSASCGKGETNCLRERAGRSPANMAAHDFNTWIWFIQWSVEELLNNNSQLKNAFVN